MDTLNQSFYNLNSRRGYPLDDASTLISDAGIKLPDGILADLCLRFPETLGKYAFLSAVHVLPTSVSCIFSVANSLDEVSFVPIASVVVMRPATAGVPYSLVPLVAGVGGWMVFGELDAGEYSGKFSTANQSLLLPRVARAYKPLPVTSILKENLLKRLTGIVGLNGSSDIKVVIEQKLIDGKYRDAIVIKLSSSQANATGSVLQKYTGPCGGRPESNTCDFPPITGLATVKPDESGNIELIFDGIESTPIPNGLLLNTDISIPDICGTNSDTPPTVIPPSGTDVCESLSLISEVSLSTYASDNYSIGGDGGVSIPTPDVQIINVAYPRCLRFFDGVESEITDIFGSWEPDEVVPNQYPCSSLGYRLDSRRALMVDNLVGARPSGVSGAIALATDEGYSSVDQFRLEGVIRLNDANRAGILLNWQGWDGNPFYRDYQAYGTRFMILQLNMKTSALELVQFNGIAFQDPIGSMKIPNLARDRWYKLTLVVTDSPAIPGKSDYRAIFSDITGLGPQDLSKNYWFQLMGHSALRPYSGHFGFNADAATASFGYLYLDLP